MHDHDHDHDGQGSMPVYQFLGNILGYPLDETLLYNVSDPTFWAGLRESLENERTHGRSRSCRGGGRQVD